MLRILGGGGRLCDSVSRRELLQIGGLGLFGLGGLAPLMPSMARASDLPDDASARSFGKAKRCLVLFLGGGPPQHSTWDPKPDAVKEIRGEIGPTSTNVPGIQISELLPLTAQHADKLAILRAMATDDNAHSSSGYAMLTGVPHSPPNVENANPGAPNNFPNIGAVLTQLRGNTGDLPLAARLPHHIYNTDQSVWPGQDAGFLGATADPWLLRCDIETPQLKVNQLALPDDLSLARFDDRRGLLTDLDAWRKGWEAGKTPVAFDGLRAKAMNLLASPQARAAFDLDAEAPELRDRYGRHTWGQSVLLARRMLEAGVGLVQVNWARGPNEPKENPMWDSHEDETNRLKNVLCPPFDQTFSAVLEDLSQRGMLDDTLVLCVSEFGRTPKFNGRGGREHWGSCFSVALAGGGVRGGQVYGSSDKDGAYPATGLVRPHDLTATVYHLLGLNAETLIRDTLGRPHPISRGQVVDTIL